MKKQSGFSLVELLVAAAIGIIALFAIGRSIVANDKGRKHVELMVLRDELLANLRFQLASVASLKANSLKTENDALLKCLSEDTTLPNFGGDCLNLLPKPLTFYDESGAKIAGPRGATNTALMLRYDFNGGVCTADPCALKVETSFRPQCHPEVKPNGTGGRSKTYSHWESGIAANCDQADVIEFFYYITPIMPPSGVDPTMSTLAVSGSLVMERKEIDP